MTKREFDDGSDPLRIDLGYTARDELQTLTRYSDLAGSSKVGSTTYGYDDIGRTTRIKHLDAIDAVFADYQYSFDAASRMQTEKINSDATTTFAHDGKDQLTGATGGRLETYSYDDNGNRTMSGYSIGTANRITNDGVYTYSYDKEGNITKRSKGTTDDTWFYGYDHLNHMIWAELRAEDDDQSTLLMRADYDYDALGRRIEKAVDADGDGGGGTTTTRFSYLSEPYADVPILWADLDGSSSLTTRYLRGDAVDQIFARIGSGTPAWLLQDHIGSVRNVVNNSGTILATVVNDSFGNQISAEDADTGDYRLAAMRWDGENGTFYTRGRIWGADFGGGYQEDPHHLEFPNGPNSRSYVNNSPLVRTDPTGEAFYVEAGQVEWWEKHLIEDHLEEVTGKKMKRGFRMYSVGRSRESSEWYTLFGVYPEDVQIVRDYMDSPRAVPQYNDIFRALLNEGGNVKGGHRKIVYADPPGWAADWFVHWYKVWRNEDRRSALGLRGHQDKETLSDLIEALPAIATTEAGKEEARRIARAIYNTFENNHQPRFPKLFDERNKGYYCWDWAYGFEDAFKLESSGKYFKAKVEAATTTNFSGGVHFWLRIDSLETGKSLFVDDGFMNGHYVHKSRPEGRGYEYLAGVESDKPREKANPPPACNAIGETTRPRTPDYYDYKDRTGPEGHRYRVAPWGMGGAGKF